MLNVKSGKKKSRANAEYWSGLCFGVDHGFIYYKFYDNFKFEIACKKKKNPCGNTVSQILYKMYIFKLFFNFYIWYNFF